MAVQEKVVFLENMILKYFWSFLSIEMHTVHNISPEELYSMNTILVNI